MKTLNKHVNSKAVGGKVEDWILKIRSKLSSLQLAFLDDPYRFKVLVAGRRGGKSYVDGAYLIINSLLKPGSKSIYLGLTRQSSKEAIWPIFLKFLDDVKIPHTIEISTLSIKFPNGSVIQVTGADMANMQNRLRGQKFSLIVIDEVGFFSGLKSLIDSLLPSLADYRGTIVMTSSPGELLSGPFYEAYEGEDKGTWHQFHWDMRANPHFMGPATDPKFSSFAEEELDTICRLKFGGDRESPAFRREYLGLYVKDDKYLVYPAESQNFGLVGVPSPQVSLGISLGAAGTFGAVTIEHSEFSRNINVLNAMTGSFGKTEDVEILRTWFTYSMFRTVNTGDLSDSVVQEISKRFDMAFSPADQKDKPFYQMTFRNDLIAGFVKLKETLPILTEWNRIGRGEDGLEIDDGKSRLMSDACLSLYRKIYTVHLKTWKPPLTQDEAIFERLLESYREEKEIVKELEAYD